MLTCEVERRNRLVMVRLKLEAEPRVERRESVPGVGSSALERECVSETAVLTAVQGLPVSLAGAGRAVAGLGVGACEVMRGALLGVLGG